MSNNSKILTSEQELALRQPIDETVGKIQEEIDSLRLNGTHKVIEISEMIDAVKRDKIYSKQEKEKRLTELKSKQLMIILKKLCLISMLTLIKII